MLKYEPDEDKTAFCQLRLHNPVRIKVIKMFDCKIWDLVYVSGIIYFTFAFGLLFFDTGNIMKVVPAKCTVGLMLFLTNFMKILELQFLLLRRPMTLAQK